MPEELKNLIEKIKAEGVKAAEDRARSIEEEASRKAKTLLAKAEKDAERIINEAGKKVAAMEESARVSLKQAGRDLLIALKKEINDTLDRIIVSHVHEALNPQEMAKIIAQLVKQTKLLILKKASSLHLGT